MSHATNGAATVRERSLPGWPFDLQEARERQRAAGSPAVRSVELGDDLTLKLMLIPAGEFPGGRVEEPFWIGAVEISNRIYALYDPKHDSRFINLLGATTAARGYPVNEPDQPVVRISQNQAVEFCRWLSERTGLPFKLPTETQWEWAARAGTETPFHFGAMQTRFDQHANMADRSIEG
ncbi:MAG: SUMF1/EgtB/PvdO family nonheme iron enzyme, partial [bacterium]|nr:SUMF1/EgtB/PvdO family nonheme iron enzyme [bacterium]